MRVSRRSLLGLAIVLLAGVSVALAQQPAPEPIPALDVAISVGRSRPNTTELLGRAAPDAIYSSIDVSEPGGHAYYFQSVSFSLGPDSSERVVKEVSGLTFALSASSSSRTRLVRTEVVVSRGGHVLARYHALADLPLLSSGS